MRGARGEAGPFDLSRRRQIASHRVGLVRLILYHGPICLVAWVHTSPKHAHVYLRRQAVVFRPRVYPIRDTLRPLHLSVNGNLHSSDQFPHANLQVTCAIQAWASCVIAKAITTTVLTLTITGIAADSSLAAGSNPEWARRVVGDRLLNRLRRAR